MVEENYPSCIERYNNTRSYLIDKGIRAKAEDRYELRMLSACSWLESIALSLAVIADKIAYADRERAEEEEAE